MLEISEPLEHLELNLVDEKEKKLIAIVIIIINITPLTSYIHFQCLTPQSYLTTHHGLNS